jgi:hypothetical protein
MGQFGKMQNVRTAAPRLSVERSSTVLLKQLTHYVRIFQVDKFCQRFAGLVIPPVTVPADCS